ncbi:MAG TPA: tetratricopeptide repeat protein [Myxococcaceae bacterium]|jgi:hypothetical protein
MSENLECPECRAPVAPDDFLCENCQLLLNPQLASGEYVISEPSIVRALISPPMRTSSREIPAAGEELNIHELDTVRFSIPIEKHEVPYLTADINIALRPLRPFEAYVASFIDGTQSVSALAKASKLPEIEIKVVLKALMERGLVELHERPATRPPEDELPLLEGAEFLVEEPPIAAGTQAPEPLPPPPEALHSKPRAPRIPIPVPPASPTSRPTASRTVPAPVPVVAPVAPPPPSKPASRAGAVASPAHSSASSAPERLEDLLQRVVRFEREGQVDRAIELLKRGLAKTSAPAPLYNKLALILVDQRKDFTQAAELLKRAVELDPRNPVYPQNLSKVMGLAANAPNSRKEPKRGLLSRLTGRS